jgi:hypothetical protein
VKPHATIVMLLLMLPLSSVGGGASAQTVPGSTDTAEPIVTLETNAPASPEPFAARGLAGTGDAQTTGSGSRVARIALFPVRAAVQLGTFPLRTIGGALSSTGWLQRMARGYAHDRYLVPVAGVDPSPGRNFGLRAGHGSFFDRDGCVTYRLAFGGTKEQLYAVTLRSRDAELTPYRSGWSYRLTAKYEIIPDKTYFGLGNASDRDSLAYYTRERYLLLASLRYALTSWVRWDFTAALQRSQIDRAAYLDSDERSIEEVFSSESEAPGMREDPQNIQGEMALILDRRDSRGHPHCGWKAEGFFGYAHGTGGDGVSFVRYGGEAQGYVPLGARHGIAVHAAGEETRTNETDAAGSEVPIKLTELPSLGGRSTLRGYLNDRFIDNAAVFWTGEYRYRLSDIAEFCAFADFGRVLPRLLDFDFNDLHRSFGAGLRFASDTEFYFTLQVARSDEDVVLTGTLEPIFDRVDRRERR